VIPTRATVVEVGPRDGLQSGAVTLPTEAKVRYVDALSAAGLPVIEVTSFVSPRWIPMLADAEEVMRSITRRPGVRYPVLVPNDKGLDRALAAGAREIAVFTAASETFNRRNLNAGIEESLARIEPVARRAKDLGLWVRGYVSTCFGCPYEGDVSKLKVAEVARALVDLGADEVSIGDTIGVATPNRVEEVVSVLLAMHAAARLALHFHDTYGMALANVDQALRMGIATFDVSSGGIGGCPYAPGAAGNLATEDLVYLLEGRGIATGVDLDLLVQASRILEEAAGTTLPGKTYRAWLSRTRQAPE
jgi:isopropylmalate/homocitrate/citramalate synthase